MSPLITAHEGRWSSLQKLAQEAICIFSRCKKKNNNKISLEYYFFCKNHTCVVPFREYEILSINLDITLIYSKTRSYSFESSLTCSCRFIGRSVSVLSISQYHQLWAVELYPDFIHLAALLCHVYQTTYKMNETSVI